MNRLMAVCAALVVGFLVSAGSARALECSADSIAATLNGTWQVNNAGGEGFGGWWVNPDTGAAYEEEKPQVPVHAGDGSISIASSGQLPITNIHIDETEGGEWCGFTIGGYGARVNKADNGWWIFEIGAHDGNQIEMIKR